MTKDQERNLEYAACKFSEDYCRVVRQILDEDDYIGERASVEELVRRLEFRFNLEATVGRGDHG